MKNIWLKSALIAVASFSTVSCADFLDLTPEDLIVEDNYWNEKNDVDQVLTGCYTRMQDHDFLSRAFIWGEARADNVAVGNTKAGDAEYEILQENILSTNAYTSWTPFYSVINRCNLVIDRAPKVAEIDPNFSESEVRATIAEAAGIRALCYFYLVRTFKDVPYYTYAITADDQELTLPVTDGEQILNALIDELVSVQGDASLKVLSGARDITCARMSRVAIWTLIADMCLWQHKYDMAIEYADKVIAYKNRFNPNSAEYDQSASTSSSNFNFLRRSYYAGTDNTGADKMVYFPLLDDDVNGSVSVNGTILGNGVSGTAFTRIFGTGMSEESIFELVFEGVNASDNMKNNDMIDDFFRRYVKRNNIDPSPGRFTAAQQFADQFNLTTGSGTIFLPWTGNANSDNALSTPDSRFLESICFSGATKGNASGGELVKYNWSTSLVFPRGGSNSYYYTSSANLESLGRARTSEKNNANWIFYRVSDAMLIKAEALVCGHPEDESSLRQAFSLVQAINDRSNTEKDITSGVTALNFSNYGSSDVLNTLILDERRREFLFEGKRWFDLVRWSRRVGNTEKLKAACITKMPNGATSGSGKLTNMNAIYFPYNKTELQTNPNLQQNPAYPEVDNDSYESTN